MSAVSAPERAMVCDDCGDPLVAESIQVTQWASRRQVPVQLQFCSLGCTMRGLTALRRERRAPRSVVPTARGLDVLIPTSSTGGEVMICETPRDCTCGAPETTPRGMHHDDCAVRGEPA